MHQRKDPRIAVLMFGNKGQPQNELVALNDAVQFGLFSISQKTGKFRRFTRSNLCIKDGVITVPPPDAPNGHIYRWDPDLESQPLPGSSVHPHMFMDDRRRRERDAFKLMEEYNFDAPEYTGIIPVYVDQSNLPCLDRVELMRSVVHGINGTIPFKYDLSQFPESQKALNEAPRPFRDVGTQFESTITDEHALETLMSQMVDQYSVAWHCGFRFIPAQWVEKPITDDTVVFVQPHVPICFLAANPHHLNIRRGVLDLQFGRSPSAMNKLRSTNKPSNRRPMPPSLRPAANTPSIRIAVSTESDEQNVSS